MTPHLDSVVQRSLVLNILRVHIRPVPDQEPDQSYDQSCIKFEGSFIVCYNLTRSALWTLLMRQVPPKWFAMWMSAPAVTRARIMARWLKTLNIIIYY